MKKQTTTVLNEKQDGENTYIEIGNVRGGSGIRVTRRAPGKDYSNGGTLCISKQGGQRGVAYIGKEYADDLIRAIKQLAAK